ncbi:MAG: GNAT family N-acetyltransferase [Candidatus Coatesbacteria bacterium]|nr:GNAT family N-acetyltransferase [Candidatus Coatesbacteria bacterium]
MNEVFFLKGRHPENGVTVGLSPLDIERDLPDFVRWLNNREVIRNLLLNIPINVHWEKKKLEEIACSADMFFFLIFIISENDLKKVGCTSLELFEIKKSYKLRLKKEYCYVHEFTKGGSVFSKTMLRKGDIVGKTGTLIAEKEYWRKGIGSVVKMITLSWAFSSMRHLQLISTEAYIENSASLCLMGKAFHKEVVDKEKLMFKDNKLLDSRVMELNRENWEKNIDFFQKFIL